MRSKVPLKLIFKTIVSTPDLIPTGVRFQYRKKFGADRDVKRGDGISSKPPYLVSLRITNACNHRCAVCGQYGEKGYMLSSDKKKPLLKTLPVERYKELVDNLAFYKPIYYATGGEPFLYPGLVELLNYAKEKGSSVDVVTNGIKLKQYAEEIVKNQWDMIVVSFDGPEEIHDQCRKTKGAYRTTVDGLLEVQKWKERLGRKKPIILTTNIEYLDKTFEIGKIINPDVMVIYLAWFTSEQLGRAQDKLLKDTFGIESYTWKSYAREFTEEEATLFMDNLDKVEKMKWPFEYLVVPNLKGSDVKDYYLKPSKMFGFDRCITPFMEVNIMPNGDVVTCRDYIDVKAGNISEDKLLDIWNNEKFVKFRKLLIENKGLLPQCTRCCGLMGF
jgi:radical SAM protein with 4Fe4S-binding SPASM domain